MPTLAESMMSLFEGFSGAHGTHGDTEQRPGGVKREIKKTARTLRDPVTLELWEQHLAGTRALGIITIREDSTCLWGAVDVDKYDLVHMETVRWLAEMKIPGIVCRTKSGGAHVFLFFSEPIPASEVIPKLHELASAMGSGGSEVFPKQANVLVDRGDLGNWLNMPYFGGDKTSRYAVAPDGRGLSVGQFVALAQRSRITRRQFAGLRMVQSVAEMSDGPPCLEYLASVKIGEGSRNNGMYNLAVLAKRMRPDGWSELLEDWNRRFLSPPGSSADVQAMVKRFEKKDYHYKCNDQPIAQHCNVAVCRGRKFGVGPGGAARIVSSVSVLDTDPPLFFVNLKTGGTVECDSSALLSPRDFQRLALVQLRQVIPLYTTEVWLGQIQVCVDEATLIEAPREVGTTGHFEEILERFCTDRHAADNRDELILGKPWRDDAKGVVWFRLRDLQAMMEQERFRELTRGQVATRIRTMGGTTGFFNIRGKGVNVWCVPSDKLQWQTSQTDVPRAEEPPL